MAIKFLKELKGFGTLYQKAITNFFCVKVNIKERKEQA